VTCAIVHRLTIPPATPPSLRRCLRTDTTCAIVHRLTIPPRRASMRSL
jgi:hypothetical protein